MSGGAGRVQRAILGYHATGNFGDAVQSYAMLRLLGSNRAVTLVDREDIGSFAPHVETVLVMNGWFGHRPDRFFLAPRVRPAMVGVHLSPVRPVYSRYPPFSDVVRDCPSVRRVFQQSAPVGARDLYTLAALRDVGIESYFSGCPTLTLERKGLASDGSVVAVDVPDSVCRVLERRLGQAIIRVSNDSDSSWRSTAALHVDVEPYLDRLERARLLITTRLHAALPARALGVHTVFAPSDPTDPRYSGLADFLPVTVPLADLARMPLSLFEAAPWEPARGLDEQVQRIRDAVAAAVGPRAPDRADNVESARLLAELEQAALVYDRVHLPERRLLHYIRWVNRLWR